MLLLTGSALAVSQQRMYRSGEAEASHTAVQQHSVFIEIVVEQKNGTENIHEFAAVVGLIKECKRVRNVFDNAVLWFNDQFLFGQKSNRTTNESFGPTIGFNPEDNNLMKKNGETGRWGGCFIPDGFAMAIGADDPFGVGPAFSEASYEGGRACVSHPTNTSNETCEPPRDNMDVVKDLIDLDNRCQGCIFEYQSSFFITDPNYPSGGQEVRWIVDKLVYPLSATGNLFQEGEDNWANDGECASGNGTINISDPRDNYPHHDRCRDDPNDDRQHKNNHRCGGNRSDCRPLLHNATENKTGRSPNATLVEPLYTVHLQVDPTTNMGFVDQAPWEYKTGEDADGMPIAQSPLEDAFEKCKIDKHKAYECSVEYNFLLAVDFEAFDDKEAIPGEDEIREDDVKHGQYQFPQPLARDGNSHPHNPQTSDAGPHHKHNTVSLDIFFHERAPFYVMENPYWDEDGGPPAVNDTCSGVPPTSDASAEQKEAVEVRSPIVCDTDRDDGRYHSHDGDQTID